MLNSLKNNLFRTTKDIIKVLNLNQVERVIHPLKTTNPQSNQSYTHSMNSIQNDHSIMHSTDSKFNQSKLPVDKDSSLTSAAFVLDLNPESTLLAHSQKLKDDSYLSHLQKQTAFIGEKIGYLQKQRATITKPLHSNKILPLIHQNYSFAHIQQSHKDNIYLEAIQKNLVYTLSSLYKTYFQTQFIALKTCLNGKKELLKLNVPVVQSILVIGIHGWFQRDLVQSVVGKATGTSTRFTQKMASTIKHYFIPLQSPIPQITLLPLESDGLVEERVGKMMQEIQSQHREKFLVNDMIMVCTHSQGCPVSTLLLAKLFEKAILLKTHKVAMLCMASITHGPFPNLKSNIVVQYVEKEAARQLFDYCSQESVVSRQFQKSIGYILDKGVRIVAMGSWFDQVVPLYSSTMQGVTHPNLFKSVFISGHDYKHDVLSRLVVFGLTLKNLGMDDYDLILYLSEFVSGSLWSGTQGHSTIYEDEDVYKLALDWALDPVYHHAIEKKSRRSNYRIFSQWIIKTQPTMACYLKRILKDNTKVKKLEVPFEAPVKLNPYMLTWIMSMILKDKKIQSDSALKDELDNILRMYDNWNPQGGKEKDLKNRLEPINLKSKL